MNNITLIPAHPIISCGTSSFAIANKTGALKRFYISFKDIYNIDMNTVTTTTTTVRQETMGRLCVKKKEGKNNE